MIVFPQNEKYPSLELALLVRSLNSATVAIYSFRRMCMPKIFTLFAYNFLNIPVRYMV